MLNDNEKRFSRRAARSWRNRWSARAMMGLIYVNPEGPNGNSPDPMAAAAATFVNDVRRAWR